MKIRALVTRDSSVVESRGLLACGGFALGAEFAVVQGFFLLIATVLVWKDSLTRVRHEGLIERLNRRDAREATEGKPVAAA